MDRKQARMKESGQDSSKGERKLTGSKQGGKKVDRLQARVKESGQEASKVERKWTGCKQG